MKKIIKIELKNIFSHSGYIIGIIIIFLFLNVATEGVLSFEITGKNRIFLYDIINFEKSDFLGSVKCTPINIFINAIRCRYLPVALPLATALSSISIFCFQRKSKFYYFETIRVKNSEYIYGKIISNVIASAGITITSCLLFWIELIVLLPSQAQYINLYGRKMVENTTIIRQSLFNEIIGIDYNFIYVIVTIFFVTLVGIVGSLMAKVICVISEYNKFVSIAGTALIFNALGEIMISSTIPAISSLTPNGLLNPDCTSFYSKSWLNFSLYAIYIILVIGSMVCLNVLMEKKR